MTRRPPAAFKLGFLSAYRRGRAGGSDLGNLAAWIADWPTGGQLRRRYHKQHYKPASTTRIPYSTDVLH
jgi:hypothetical protein